MRSPGSAWDFILGDRETSHIFCACEHIHSVKKARREEACRILLFFNANFFTIPLESISNGLVQHWHQNTNPGLTSEDIEVEISV